MATPTVYVICDQNCKFEGMTKEQIYAAIVQAVNEGTISNIDTGFITTLKTINGVPIRFFVGERTEYDALSDEEKKNLFAIITNEDTAAQLVEFVNNLENNIKGLEDTLLKIIEQLESGAIVVGKAKKDSEGNTISEKYVEVLSGTLKTTSSNCAEIGVAYSLGSLPKGKRLEDVFAVAIKGDMILSGLDSAESPKTTSGTLSGTTVVQYRYKSLNVSGMRMDSTGRLICETVAVKVIEYLGSIILKIDEWIKYYSANGTTVAYTETKKTTFDDLWETTTTTAAIYFK